MVSLLTWFTDRLDVELSCLLKPGKPLTERNSWARSPSSMYSNANQGPMLNSKTIDCLNNERLHLKGKHLKAKMSE